MIKNLIKLSIVPFILAFIGSMMNLVVRIVNGGMPVKGISPLDAHDRWIPLTQASHLKYLADILPFYLSIGDILMFVAALYFIGGFIYLEVKRCTKQNCTT